MFTLWLTHAENLETGPDEDLDEQIIRLVGRPPRSAGYWLDDGPEGLVLRHLYWDFNLLLDAQTAQARIQETFPSDGSHPVIDIFVGKVNLTNFPAPAVEGGDVNLILPPDRGQGRPWQH